jgi:hypothetical protein
MIQRAVAVGAAAWTAPVIIDSLGSPAAASTPAPLPCCLAFRYSVASSTATCAADTWSDPTDCSPTGTVCVDATTTLSPDEAGCLAPTTSCIGNVSSQTFAVSVDCACTIVAAEATYTANSEGQVPGQCAQVVITPNGSTVTFTGVVNFAFWETFRIWLNCCPTT